MERAVGKNEKLENFKLQSLKLESFAEVGKSLAKLERTDRSWKVSFGVGKFWLKLESLNELGKLSSKLESVTALNKFIRVKSEVDGPN